MAAGALRQSPSPSRTDGWPTARTGAQRGPGHRSRRWGPRPCPGSSSGWPWWGEECEQGVSSLAPWSALPTRSGAGGGLQAGRHWYLLAGRVRPVTRARLAVLRGPPPGIPEETQLAALTLGPLRAVLAALKGGRGGPRVPQCPPHPRGHLLGGPSTCRMMRLPLRPPILTGWGEAAGELQHCLPSLTVTNYGRKANAIIPPLPPATETPWKVPPLWVWTGGRPLSGCRVGRASTCPCPQAWRRLTWQLPVSGSHSAACPWQAQGSQVPR